MLPAAGRLQRRLAGCSSKAAQHAVAAPSPRRLLLAACLPVGLQHAHLYWIGEPPSGEDSVTST